MKMSFRKPPKPASWRAPKGACRFCGGPIYKPDRSLDKRRNWHPACVDEWIIMNQPQAARAWVWDHFKGTCQECNKSSWSYDERWECDHIQPLFLAAGDLSYWAKENLTLLCEDCHKKKTKTDNQLFREVADMRNFTSVRD